MGNNANESEARFRVALKLVLLIGRYKNGITLFQFMHLAFGNYRSSASQDKYLMLPGVSVPGSVASWAQVKDSHSEVGGAFLLADDDADVNSLSLVRVFPGLHLQVVFHYHDIFPPSGLETPRPGVKFD